MVLKRKKRGSAVRLPKRSNESGRNTESADRYEIIIQPSAAREIEQAYLWRAGQYPIEADDWYNVLVESITSLSQNPERCRLAPEADAFHQPIRQLLVGKRRSMFRVLFTVDGGEVHVLHVRHAARQHLEP